MNGLSRLFLLFLCLLVIGCEKKPSPKQSDDFNVLMGSNKSVWKFIETQEDYQNLLLFKGLYEKNKALQSLSSDQVKIPKVIHFIWIGPASFPKESIENVDSWADKHPDWTIKFWTDRRRPLPNKKMELNLISGFELSELKQCFDESDNYAEKSDLLRYEILYREGGLYVDHDVKCFKSFSPFHHHFDLYCGLEPPHKPVLSSSVSVNNNIIGTRSGHPILKNAIELVKTRWAEISEAYPGTDKQSIIYRVANRSFAAFDDSVRNLCGQESNKDIIFPAAYFNQIDGDFAIFAHHYYASTWFTDETKFEKNVRQRLISISRKNNQILLFNGVILTTNMVLFICLIFQYRALRKRR